MSTIQLTKDYGYTSYKITGLAPGTIIDAGAATWFHDNNSRDGSSNPYPFLVNQAPKAILDGGTILGKIDQTSEWRAVYNLGNSAAVRTEDSPGVVIRDWRITDTWDAIRVSWNCPDFLIEDVWVTNSRDDAVENDRLQSGIIRNSLFDGVFGGISIDPSSASPVDGHNQTVKLDGVLMRLKSFLYEGEMTHSAFIKTDSATNGTVTPNLSFVDCVIAIEDVKHNSYRSMFDAWANTVESKGNVFLNLSNTPLPSDYPKPPAGWTILQGQQARDYWQGAKAEWIKDHAGGASPDPTPPTTPPTTPTTPPPAPNDDATFAGVKFEGNDDDETIIGNKLNNFIDGDNGDDRIHGGAGNDTIRGDDGVDVLWGDAGNDVFFFKRTKDSYASSGIDTIMDFTKGDRIDLSVIDANSKVSGDQAFSLISGEFTKTPGQLKITFDAGSGHTVITGNTDADLAAEFTIQLAGHVGLAASDFLL